MTSLHFDSMRHLWHRWVCHHNGRSSSSPPALEELRFWSHLFLIRCGPLHQAFVHSASSLNFDWLLVWTVLRSRIYGCPTDCLKAEWTEQFFCCCNFFVARLQEKFSLVHFFFVVVRCRIISIRHAKLSHSSPTCSTSFSVAAARQHSWYAASFVIFVSYKIPIKIVVCVVQWWI